MPITVTFNTQLKYGANVTTGVRTGVGSRAYVWIRIINPANGNASRRVFGLIDSGCDDCFLDSGLLSGLGLSTTATTVTVAGGGSVAATIVNGAEIEIEGVVVSGRPLTFGSAATPLVGRDIYLRAFELAFRGKDWLLA
jgi:predicted aspartyl protease